MKSFRVRCCIDVAARRFPTANLRTGATRLQRTRRDAFPSHAHLRDLKPLKNETFEARSKPHRLVFNACCPQSCLLLFASVHAAENRSPNKTYWHKAHRLLTMVFRVVCETNSRWKANVLTKIGCVFHDCMHGRRPPKKIQQRPIQYFHIGPKLLLSRRHTGRRFPHGSPSHGPRVPPRRAPAYSL